LLACIPHSLHKYLFDDIRCLTRYRPSRAESVLGKILVQHFQAALHLFWHGDAGFCFEALDRTQPKRVPIPGFD
jgi:hypothetical protein